MNPFRPRGQRARSRVEPRQQQRPQLQVAPQVEQEPPVADPQIGIPLATAARLQLNNQVDVERFMQNLRVILQRQSMHFDVGGGDGVLVWSWRIPTPATGQQGEGDGESAGRRALRQVLPTL